MPDILTSEVVTGALGPGTTGGDFPTFVAGVLGAKFRLVRGYKGCQGLALALERSEVQVIWVSWAVIKARWPDILKGTTDFRVFARGDSGEDSVLAKAGVPPLASLARNDLDRQALAFYMSQFVFAFPFLLPPNVPSPTVQTLRTAFAETMSDPDLLADARKENIDISYTRAEEVQRMITQLYQTPAGVVDRVKKYCRLRDDRLPHMRASIRWDRR